MTAPQLRQPRLAELVADRLRAEILSGGLADGDHLPRQEVLLEKFKVSAPSLREALRILETENLVTVRRGNVGGAVVHLPAPHTVAYTASLVLQSHNTKLRDVAHALGKVEPLCAGLCAEREDRARAVLPALEAAVAAQRSSTEDLTSFNRAAREFHETIVGRCGNETMALVVGALEALWSAHEADWATRAEAGGKHVSTQTIKAGLRDHEKMLQAIARGESDKASKLAAAHLAASQSYTLEGETDRPVDSSLVR